MALKVTDIDGHVIDQDEPGRPVEYYNDEHGDKGFRVTKVSPPDEHYFGLGDKTGPLDRRNEAFTDWNTDAFGFQESTDPIYKSIPFLHRPSMQGRRRRAVSGQHLARRASEFNKEQRDGMELLPARRRPAGLLHPLWPRPEGRCWASGPGWWALRRCRRCGRWAISSRATATIPSPRCGSIAKHLRSGAYSCRRDLAGHRLPAEQPALHRGSASASRTSTR